MWSRPRPGTRTKPPPHVNTTVCAEMVCLCLLAEGTGFAREPRLCPIPHAATAMVTVVTSVDTKVVWRCLPTCGVGLDREPGRSLPPMLIQQCVQKWFVCAYWQRERGSPGNQDYAPFPMLLLQWLPLLLPLIQRWFGGACLHVE